MPPLETAKTEDLLGVLFKRYPDATVILPGVKNGPLLRGIVDHPVKKHLSGVGEGMVRFGKVQKTAAPLTLEEKVKAAMEGCSHAGGTFIPADGSEPVDFWKGDRETVNNRMLQVSKDAMEALDRLHSGEISLTEQEEEIES